MPIPRLAGTKGRPRRLGSCHLLADTLGSTQEGGLRQPQAGQAGQNLLGGLGKAALHPGQAGDFLRRGGALMALQSQQGIERKTAVAAVSTRVVVTSEADDAQQT